MADAADFQRRIRGIVQILSLSQQQSFGKRQAVLREVFFQHVQQAISQFPRERAPTLSCPPGNLYLILGISQQENAVAPVISSRFLAIRQGGAQTELPLKLISRGNGLCIVYVGADPVCPPVNPGCSLHPGAVIRLPRFFQNGQGNASCLSVQPHRRLQIQQVIDSKPGNSQSTAQKDQAQPAKQSLVSGRQPQDQGKDQQKSCPWQQPCRLHNIGAKGASAASSNGQPNQSAHGCPPL